MIKTTLICTTASLLILSITFIAHIVAMAYPRWKIYEPRRIAGKSIFIGIFQRCEYYSRAMQYININYDKTDLICDDNKYCFCGNKKCAEGLNQNQSNIENLQKLCHVGQNSYNCAYSSFAKGLIACTIISAVTLGLSLILIFSHIIINEFKYKIHIYIAIITIVLLILAFLFMLITLILLGSTMAYDLYQYVYNLDYQVNTCKVPQDQSLEELIKKKAAKTYEIRLDWSSVLEIIALVLAGFTIVTQISYLFFTRRNRIG